MALPDGLYDLLLTEGLARSLAALDPAARTCWRSRAAPPSSWPMSSPASSATILDDVSGDDDRKAKRQLELVNGCW